MTQTHIAITDERDSARAGSELGDDIRTAFGGAPADAIVVFASAQHDYPKLLKALAEAAGTTMIAGASSAGEFTNQSRGEGQVSALGIRTPNMKFAVGLGQGVSTDTKATTDDSTPRTCSRARRRTATPSPRTFEQLQTLLSSAGVAIHE